MGKGDQFERHFDRKKEAEDRAKKALPGEDEEPLPPPVETIRKQGADVGRNDPCPCGSGKKYKQCCLTKEPKKK